MKNFGLFAQLPSNISVTKVYINIICIRVFSNLCESSLIYAFTESSCIYSAFLQYLIYCLRFLHLKFEEQITMLLLDPCVNIVNVQNEHNCTWVLMNCGDITNQYMCTPPIRVLLPCVVVESWTWTRTCASWAAWLVIWYKNIWLVRLQWQFNRPCRPYRNVHLQCNTVFVILCCIVLCIPSSQSYFWRVCPEAELYYIVLKQNTLLEFVHWKTFSIALITFYSTACSETSAELDAELSTVHCSFPVLCQDTWRFSIDRTSSTAFLFR